MSVVSWEWTDEEGGRIGPDGEIVGHVRIRCNSPDDGFSVLSRDTPTLQRWQRHPSEPGYFVAEFLPERIPYAHFDTGNGVHCWWNASVRYSNKLTENPLDEPAKLVTRSQTISGGTILDKDGDVIMNAAGDIPTPFDKPRRVRVFTFTKNIATPQDWLFDWEGEVVNSDTVKIYSKNCTPRTLRFESVTIGERQVVNDVGFFVHTVELAYLKSTWDQVWPNRGFNQLVEEIEPFAGSSIITQRVTRKRPIYILGQVPSQPQFLDADGKWIPRPTPDEIVYNTTKIYAEKPFRNLPVK